jgi:ATP-binding cassette, subfamily B (MDR/TAP), member 1
LKHIAEGGSLAEEVISTVRTAQAFGTQSILGGLYNKYIEGSLNVDLKAARWHGGGLAIFFFILYSAYALGQHFHFLLDFCWTDTILAFSFGTTLINSNHGQFSFLFYVALFIDVAVFSYGWRDR